MLNISSLKKKDNVTSFLFKKITFTKLTNKANFKKSFKFLELKFRIDLYVKYIYILWNEK